MHQSPIIQRISKILEIKMNLEQISWAQPFCQIQDLISIQIHNFFYVHGNEWRQKSCHFCLKQNGFEF